MSKSTELIVHIGQGKTGTSSIQYKLHHSEELLEKKGYKYLGNKLQHSTGYNTDVNYFDHTDLKKKDQSKAFKLLLEELEKPANTGKKLIWSNERLFSLMIAVEVLLEIKKLGYTVTVIVYVRRHDLWAKSAHAQWAVKHKFKSGAVNNYKDWKEKYDIQYSKHLRRWKNKFSDTFVIRNFDSIKDTASDFMDILGMKGGAKHQRNKSPGNEVLYAWAVYNSIDNNPKVPGEFEKLLSQMKRLSSGFDNHVEKKSLLPSKDDILETYIDNSDDIIKVNKILEEYNQPLFSDDVSRIQDSHIDSDRLMEFMLKLIFTQQKQISNLQSYHQNEN